MILKIETQLTTTRNKGNIRKKTKKSQKLNPKELWDYNIPQSIGDVWSDFKLRIKKEKWDEVFIEKESESNLWTQMVSNISPAQPMKMDTFERPLAGEWIEMIL